MSKKLSDYLPYYLGAEVRVQRANCNNIHTGRICEISKGSNHVDWIEVNFGRVVDVTAKTFEGVSSSNMHHYFLETDIVMLVLRPLDSMTEEENNESSKLYFDFMETQRPGTRDIKMMAHMTKWFIDKHFDLFGLIESGLALDKSKLQP